MPDMSWTITLGELAILACLLGLLGVGLRYWMSLRSVARQSRENARSLSALIRRLHDLESSALGKDELKLLNGDLVSKLAVAVSLLVQHLEISNRDKKNADEEAIDAIRQSCLAIIENIWLSEVQDACEASKASRIAAYKQSTSVRELREKIEQEETLLRGELEAINHRLEEMMDTTQGRYAKASNKLAGILERLVG